MKRLKNSIGQPPETAGGARVPGERRLPLLLRRAWFSLNQAFRRRCAELGVTPDQYTALRTILEGCRAGITQRELVEAMSSDPNTIASLLNRMEASGWIERRPHEADRRAHRLRVLRPGRAKFLQARRVALALQKTVLAALPEAGRARFMMQLAAVADACHGCAAEAGRANSNSLEDRLTGQEQTRLNTPGETSRVSSARLLQEVHGSGTAL